MQGKMFVFRPEIAAPIIHHYDRPLRLAELRDAVGGDIEPVPYFQTIFDPEAKVRVPCVAFCDEHGKIENKPRNAVANIMWRDALRANPPPGAISDYLVGSVAVISGDDEFMSEL